MFSVMLSVVSSAVNDTSSGAVSVTVNVATPSAPVVAGEGPVTTAVGDGEVKVTDLPCTGTLPASSSVTVTVERSCPLAVA